MSLGHPVADATHYPAEISIPGIFNTHTHPRDDDEDKDGRTEMLVPRFAKVFETIIGMGNTATALTTAALAGAKKKRWQSFVPEGAPLQILVAPLLTEKTDPNDLIAGFDQPEERRAVDAVKVFIKAASNSNGRDVDDVSKIIPFVRAMNDMGRRVYSQQHFMLMGHFERKYYRSGRRVNFLMREPESIERDLMQIYDAVPEAWVNICHVSRASTLEIIRYLRKKGYNIFGEIAPHYTQYCIDDLFEDGKGGTALNVHPFCLPIFGLSSDQQAVEDAMVSGEPFWHFGADDACHVDDTARATGVKINKDGIVLGGQTQIPQATISYVVERFAERGRLQHLSGFLSENARRAFELPPAQTVLKLTREDWEVPMTIGRDSPHWGKIQARVAMGGETRKYRVAA
ncbi:MAG TPA: hypothetical protein VHC68_01300 [Candidatus Paceibacterota bacterium]|nr:hypothetical protein [Candidatus Paceibacterota bacterium]